MVERGSHSRVGTRSISVRISGGFCYEDDSDCYLDYKDLEKNSINLNRSGSHTQVSYLYDQKYSIWKK